MKGQRLEMQTDPANYYQCGIVWVLKHRSIMQRVKEPAGMSLQRWRSVGSIQTEYRLQAFIFRCSRGLHSDLMRFIRVGCLFGSAERAPSLSKD